MNTDQIVSASSVSRKIMTFYIFIILDVSCNVLMLVWDLNGDQYDYGSANDPDVNLHSVLVKVLSG